MAEEKFEFPEMPSAPGEHDKFIPKTFNVVGKPVRRLDGYRKASGKAIYTGDVKLPGMLYARFLRCPYAHAKIKSMDTSKAEALPGVIYILKYDDPEVNLIFGYGERGAPNWKALDDIGYYEGTLMGAIVVADTLDIADEALTLIDVEWEILPFYLDIEEAEKPTATILLPDVYPKSNLTVDRCNVHKYGDVEKGFAEADIIIEWTDRNRFQGASGAEVNNHIARWDGEYLELWVHEQHPYTYKQRVGNDFGMPRSMISVTGTYNGGSFGGWVWHHTCKSSPSLVALLAKRVGRSVRLVGTRRDDFLYGSYMDHRAVFKVGAKRDGTVTAVKVGLRSAAKGPGGTRVIEDLRGNTRIPNIEIDDMSVVVSKPPAVAIREGKEKSSTSCPVFCHVAAELGLDPTEVALKNDGVEGKDMTYLAEFKREHGFPDRDSLREVIEAGKKAMDWDNKWHAAGTKKLPNGKLHGMSFVWSHEYKDNSGSASAGVIIHTDGSVNVLSLHSDIGVNAQTAYCQIVAEELGVRFEDISYRQQTDCGFVANTPGSSMDLVSTGYTVRKAAKRAKAKLLRFATGTGEYLGLISNPAFPVLTPEELDVKDSVVFEKAKPDNKKELSALGLPSPQGGAKEPIFAWAGHSQSGIKPFHFLCRAGHFCEVEVDTETGQVEITKAVCVNDVGKVVSQGGVAGQQYGGANMGLGIGVTEEHVWDPQTGVLLNNNLADYKWLGMLDCGPIDTIPVETSLGYGPYGACGIGENVTSVTAWLISPAVQNAIGKWIDGYPITPDKVLKALGKI